MPTVTRQDVSRTIAQLMPWILQGIQLDFFVKKGVTQTQFLILMVLHASESCTMSALASNLHVKMPTATGIVDRLVRLGYVQRVTDSHDRRQVFVSLTTKGRAFIRDFQHVVRRRWEEVLRTLTAKELDMFHHVLTTLHQQLRAGQHDAR